MKVVILCGGRGTRMREETIYRPKPLVEVGGKPILWHIMKKYDQFGFRDFILCLGYKGEMIKSYFYNYELLNENFTIDLLKRQVEYYNNHENPDWHVYLIDTGMDTLKGGRLSRVRKYIETDSFMVTYGDGIANIDIEALIKFHRSHGKIATLTGVRPPSRFGRLDIEGNRVTKFIEKPQVAGGYINGGFFVFEKEIFNYLSDDESCDLEIGTLEKLAEEDQLRIYKHLGDWVCIDNVRDMKYMNRLWSTGQAFWTAR